MIIDDKYTLLRRESIEMASDLLKNLLTLERYIGEQEERHHDLLTGYSGDPEVDKFQKEIDDFKSSLSPQLVTQLKRWEKKNRNIDE